MCQDMQPSDECKHPSHIWYDYGHEPYVYRVVCAECGSVETRDFTSASFPETSGVTP